LGRSFHQTHQCEHSVLVTPSLQSNSDTCIPNHQIITLLYNVYLFIYLLIFKYEHQNSIK
jgi:hypothetical protein